MRKFGAPTPAQAQAWPLIASGKDVLVTAPTGSGKTLAAFLWALDRLVGEAIAAGGTLPDRTSVLYVSPLKALSNDIRRNLEEPLGEIKALAVELGLRGARDPHRRAHRRHDGARAARGDPPAAARARHHARVALHPAHLRLGPARAARRADGDRRRDPRRGARQARRAPGAVARAARGAGVAAASRDGCASSLSASACRRRCGRSTSRRGCWSAGRGRRRRWSTSASGATSTSASRCPRTSSARSPPTSSGPSSTIGSPRWRARTGRRWCSSTRAGWSSG